MALSMEISAKIATKIGKVEGIELPDGSILPFDTKIQEQWVIHPEETKSGTCEECTALAGEIFDIGEGEIPPIHANCVCERLPLMDTYSPDGQLISPVDSGSPYTMKQLDNLENEALQSLISDSEVDELTILRAKRILKRRRGLK